MHSLMLEEYEQCSGLHTFEDMEDDNCASDCEVLPVPIPRLIQVPGPGPNESPSDHYDKYLCLDSDIEQESRGIKPVDKTILSHAKQFMEFDIISHSSDSVTSAT